MNQEGLINAAKPRSILLSLAIGTVLCTALVGLIVGTTGCSPTDQPSVPSFGTLELNESELKEAIFEAIEIEDTVERTRRWVEVMDAVNEDNLAGGIAAFDERLHRVEDREIRYFANKWARIDAEGALNHILDDWRYPRPVNEAVQEVVYVWVRHGDSKAAREYAAPNFEGPIGGTRSPKKFVVLAILTALAAEGDFDELTKLLAAPHHPEDRELWLTNIMIEMNRVRGMQDVKGWISSIPSDAPNGLKLSALQRGIRWMAKMNVTQAAIWYEEVESEAGSVALLQPLMAVYGTYEPGNSILWIADREPTKERTSLARNVVRGWIDRGPEKADEAEAFLLENRENSLVRNDLLLLLANYYVANKRYREAADLVQTVPDDLITRSLSAVFAQWSSLDVDELNAYIEEKQISQEIVDHYRASVKANPIKTTRSRTAPPPKKKAK